MRSLLRRLAVLLAGGTAALTFATGTASATVLVNQPAASVCEGHTFQVGVWYQSYSGGSRHYRVRVYNPRGVKILDKRGFASAVSWRFWTIRTHRVGRFTTIYNLPHLDPYVVYTRSKLC